MDPVSETWYLEYWTKTKFINPAISNESANYSETVVLIQKLLLQVYGTASITSEEDEMMKKEREIIEILEKEERWRYTNNTTSEGKDIGEEGNDILCCISVT
jgi:F-box protein 20